MADKYFNQALKFSDPRYYKSEKKRPGSPLVFFVHFYEGHQRVLRRHIQMVNNLGYDAFCFNMPSWKNMHWQNLFSPRFGLKHFYTAMISHFLAQAPGPKVVFAFSNPCASAIEAITLRLDNKDVVGLICDSGPSGKFIRSAWNLAIEQQKSPWLMLFFSFFWSPTLQMDVNSQLRTWPEGFPVLSIRPQKDVVIPPDHIEKIFSNLPNLNLSTFAPAEAGHLTALKLDPEPYQAQVEKFLLQLF